MESPQDAASHHDHVGVQQGFLAALSAAWEKDLPRVALAFGFGHRSDGNKVALNGLRYHRFGAPPARLQSFRAVAARGGRTPPPPGAIPEIRGDDHNKHPVRPAGPAPRSRRVTRNPAGENG